MRREYSPWGPVQSSTELAPGITLIETAGHGGIRLSAERQKQLPAWAKQIESRFCSKPTWWEEDCEMVIPYIVFYEELGSRVKKSRRELAEYGRQWNYPVPLDVE